MGKILTEEEARALAEKWEQTPPELVAGSTGPLTRQRELMKALDAVSANYIMTLAETHNKLPTQIIGEIVRERIAAQSPAAS